ncbi:MAG: phage pre-tape measure protein [Geminicoccaceae bacterium]
MGSLADLKLPTEEVNIPGAEGQSFGVRGLSVVDLSQLMQRHGEALTSVYGDAVAVDDAAFPPPHQLAQTLMAAAPLAVAEIIALAADETEMIDMVRRLPVPVQIDALAKVAVLTFHSENEVKKLAETVILGSGVLTRVMNSMTSPAPLAT